MDNTQEYDEQIDPDNLVEVPYEADADEIEDDVTKNDEEEAPVPTELLDWEADMAPDLKGVAITSDQDLEN